MRDHYLWAATTSAAHVVAAWLIHISQSFDLEPWPCDYWRFGLKPDIYDRVRLLFSDLVSVSPPGEAFRDEPADDADWEWDDDELDDEE